MIHLRDYQTAAVDAAWRWLHVREGGGLLVLPTGSGKSIVQAALIERLYREYNGIRALLVTHQRELIDQNARKLRDVLGYGEPQIGIYCAGLGAKDVRQVTLASVQSIYRDPPAADVVIIDEAHGLGRDGGQYRTMLGHEALRGAKLIGMTATPYRMDSGRLDKGEDALFAGVAYDAAIMPLVEAGYLAPLTSKHGQVQADMSGAAVRMGDYAPADSERAALEVTEAAIAEAVRLAGERRKWLVFCVGLAHAAKAAECLQRAGVTCAMVSGETPGDERADILRRFKAGELRALCNVNVLTTGFDAPDIDCLIMLRPTLSAGLWVQMLGRGMRTAEGKRDCLVLDFAGNTRALGAVCDVEPIVIDGGKKKLLEKPKAKACDACQELNGLDATECVGCGASFVREVKHESRAYDGDIMTGKRAAAVPSIEIMPVRQVDFSRHLKEGRPDSVRVTYRLGLGVSVSEWVCVAHEGSARRRAVEWWAANVVCSRHPATVAEALERLPNEFRRPARLRICKSGKYYEIVGREYDKPPEQVTMVME